MLVEAGIRAGGACLPASVGGECLPASVLRAPRRRWGQPRRWPGRAPPRRRRREPPLPGRAPRWFGCASRRRRAHRQAGRGRRLPGCSVGGRQGASERLLAVALPGHGEVSAQAGQNWISKSGAC